LKNPIFVPFRFTTWRTSAAWDTKLICSDNNVTDCEWQRQRHRHVVAKQRWQRWY